MRATRVLATVVAVVALSAFTAAQAAATPEFDAEKYPATVEGTNPVPAPGNGGNQGFAGTGIAANCEKATASNAEEGIVLPTKNSTTLEAHPKYESCVLTVASLLTGPATVSTTGCNYVFHAVKPGALEAAVDIKCKGNAQANSEVTEKSNKVKVPSSAGIVPFEEVSGGKIKSTGGITKERFQVLKVISATEVELTKNVEGAGSATVKETVTFTPDIQIVSNGGSLPTGCVVWVPAQTNIKNVEFKNEPAGPPAEITLAAENKGILTGVAAACTAPNSEPVSEYREGEVVAGEAKLAPAGKPAKFFSKGKSGVEPDPIEVGINEPHWYEQHVVVGATEPAAFIAWGKQHLEQTNGEIQGECNTLWGGTVANPQGGGLPPGGGMAVAGEVKIADFRTFNCHESPVCETTDKSKLSVEPEGLGIVVNPPITGKPEQLQWGATVTGASGAKSTVTLGAGPEIKLHVVCPETESSGKKYEKSWTGALQETLENGTAKGSAPSALKFASGELKVNGVAEGKVTGTLKMMGFDSLGILGTSNP